MGIQYYIVPLGSYGGRSDALASSLEAFGITIAVDQSPSRYPTPREIRAVLDQLDGYAVTYHVDAYTWWADVTDAVDPQHARWTSLIVQDFEGVEDEPHEFYFAKGWEDLIIQIVEKLSRVCGPLVLIDDINWMPLLITPETDVGSALIKWQALSEAVKKL